ncbi:uncharacterized protein STEHIDRAFT_118331 [Stereum hirsutum FP-91666 SS1]|uniref:uncharacterized protein n=1 Tax=Stereum hirsutum (strain FP-91666) TaxID=721885 RepID=UPI000440B9C0|nr:uncharacterized protein STEHIDRAFT_118331 [Stereum hirsutum FP-91666 SS1]EIM91219.1 hypothetical protein STEHIDRAFT_118331 [Stereum hirsutum FP-91666 SS1]
MLACILHYSLHKSRAFAIPPNSPHRPYIHRHIVPAICASLNGNLLAGLDRCVLCQCILSTLHKPIGSYMEVIVRRWTGQRRESTTARKCRSGAGGDTRRGMLSANEDTLCQNSG